MRTLALLAATGLLVSACSGGGGGGGGGRDPVTITVGNPGTPGVAIAVNDAEGAFLAIVYTDSSGEAVFDVPSGGSFAIYRVEDDGDRRVFHVLDPDSGSTWTLPIVPPDPFPSPTPLNALADVTLNPVPGGATQSQVETPCTSYGSDMLSIAGVPVGCDGANTTPELFAFAIDPAGVRVGWGYVTNVAVTPGGTVPLTIDASSTSLDSVSWTVSNIPATHSSGTSLDFYTPLAHLDIGEFGNLLAPGATTNTAAGIVPIGLAMNGRARYYVQNNPGAGEIGEGFSEDRFSATPATLEAPSDASAMALARVFLDAPVFADVSRPELTWTRGTGSPGTAAQVSYYAENAATEFVEHSVYFVPEAGTTGSLRLPEVPEELAAYRMATMFEASIGVEEPRVPADLLIERAIGIPDPTEGAIRRVYGYYSFP